MEINNFLKPSQAQQEVSNRLKPGPKDKSGFLRVEGRISRETSDLIEKMISESPYFTTRSVWITQAIEEKLERDQNKHITQFDTDLMRGSIS